jgi:hypothetical protein
VYAYPYAAPANFSNAPRTDSNLVQSAYQKPVGPRQAPASAGRVMYFHKSADALVPDGMADPGAVAMAADAGVPPSSGVPDTATAPPGLLPPVQPPATVVQRPIAAAGFEPTAAPLPYLPSPAPGAPALPSSPTLAMPIPPRYVPMQSDHEPRTLPPRDKIFTMLDDAALERVILDSISRQTGKQQTLPFPELKPTVPAGVNYVAKTANLPPGRILFEPGFVIHHRLHFEEKNSERYGWDLGPIQPLVSTLAFYKNIALWPSSLVTGAIVGFWDTNEGKCLPGSPTPYYLYPQGLTVTGLAADGLVITGLSFVIP